MEVKKFAGRPHSGKGSISPWALGSRLTRRMWWTVSWSCEAQRANSVGRDNQSDDLVAEVLFASLGATFCLEASISTKRSW
jgi:hypothetical protein